MKRSEKIIMSIFCAAVFYMGSLMYSAISPLTSFGRKIKEIGDYYGELDVDGKIFSVTSSSFGFIRQFDLDCGRTYVRNSEKMVFGIPFSNYVKTEVVVAGERIYDPKITAQARELSDRVLDQALINIPMERATRLEEAASNARKDLSLK